MQIIKHSFEFYNPGERSSTHPNFEKEELSKGVYEATWDAESGQYFFTEGEEEDPEEQKAVDVDDVSNDADASMAAPSADAASSTSNGSDMAMVPRPGIKKSRTKRGQKRKSIIELLAEDQPNAADNEGTSDASQSSPPAKNGKTGSINFEQGPVAKGNSAGMTVAAAAAAVTFDNEEALQSQRRTVCTKVCISPVAIHSPRYFKLNIICPLVFNFSDTQ